MDDFRFEAIGTHWCIRSDERVLSKDTRQAVLSFIDTFDKQYSRFIDSSEANSFHDAKPGHYLISEDLRKMLTTAEKLRDLTDGGFDPAVGKVLESAGYDKEYSFKETANLNEIILSDWQMKGRRLKIGGPLTFDLGGIGKGYCIDRVAEILCEFGNKAFVVEAGGDIFATHKKDGAPWIMAVAYPGREDEAASVVELKNSALAVSDVFRRRWGRWHHIVDIKKCQPVTDVVGAAAVAPTAFEADCMTSALFFATATSVPACATEFNASYVQFKADGSCLKSRNWPGEVFTE